MKKNTQSTFKIERSNVRHLMNNKTKKIVHYFNDGIVAEGQNNLKVVVTDNVGNSSIFETQFFRSQIKK